MLNNKNEFLGIDDAVYENVQVEEWDTWVRIKMMSGLEREAYEGSLFAYRDEILKAKENEETSSTEFSIVHMKCLLLIFCIVDDKGNTIFELKDISVLKNKNLNALDKIYNASKKLNAIGVDEEEDVEKNSEADQQDKSTSN